MGYNKEQCNAALPGPRGFIASQLRYRKAHRCPKRRTKGKVLCREHERTGGLSALSSGLYPGTNPWGIK